MPIRQLRRFAVLGVAFLLVGSIVESALALGYWNLPSSYAQYFGYGNGPGQHVPMVLGPVQCDGWLGMGVRRLPYAPTPGPAACTNCGPATTVPLFQTTVLP